MRSCLILAVFLLASTPALAQGPEEALVRKPLEAYLQAQATGNGDLIRQAFWPEGHLVMVIDGKLSTLSVEAFARRFGGKPSPTAAQTKRTIERVDVTGNAAIATIVLDGPTRRITDYMTLLKVEGEWRIIHKSFHAEPRAGDRAAR